MAFQKRYMKKHLKDYVLFQIGQGYDPEDIKKLLLEYGYSQQLVEETFNDIGDTHPTAAPKKSKKHMSNDLYLYLQQLLIDFILKEREQGYDFNAIKKALFNYGHNESLVNSAINAVKDGGSKLNYKELMPEKEIPEKKQKKENPGLKFPSSFLYFSMILAVLCFVVYLTIATSADIYIIFVSFLPILIAISVNYFAVLQFKSDHYLQLVPPLTVILAVFLFVGMLQYNSPLKSLSQPGVILALNAIGTFILSSVLCFFSDWPHLGEKPLPQEVIQKEHKQPSPDTSLEQNLAKGTQKLENLVQDKQKKKNRLQIKDF